MLEIGRAEKIQIMEFFAAWEQVITLALPWLSNAGWISKANKLLVEFWLYSVYNNWPIIHFIYMVVLTKMLQKFVV